VRLAGEGSPRASHGFLPRTTTRQSHAGRASPRTGQTVRTTSTAVASSRNSSGSRVMASRCGASRRSGSPTTSPGATTSESTPSRQRHERTTLPSSRGEARRFHGHRGETIRAGAARDGSTSSAARRSRTRPTPTPDRPLATAGIRPLPVRDFPKSFPTARKSAANTPVSTSSTSWGSLVRAQYRPSRGRAESPANPGLLALSAWWPSSAQGRQNRPFSVRDFPTDFPTWSVDVEHLEPSGTPYGCELHDQSANQRRRLYSRKRKPCTRAKSARRRGDGAITLCNPQVAFWRVWGTTRCRRGSGAIG